MLHDVAVALNHAGQKQHVIGQFVPAQRFQFVLMARIAELDAERADVGLIEHGQDKVERDVVEMRAVPVAPAAVQTHAFSRDAIDRLIERRNVHLGSFHEFAVGRSR